MFVLLILTLLSDCATSWVILWLACTDCLLPREFVGISLILSMLSDFRSYFGDLEYYVMRPVYYKKPLINVVFCLFALVDNQPA